MTEPAKPSSMKRALQVWAEQHNITPAEFARQAQYSYNHAYQLLRGGQDVGTDTLGRIMLHYGVEAAGEITILAKQFEQEQESKQDCE